MAVAKRVSGDRTLKVGTKEYVMRLDFEAIAAIEDHFDKSIIDFFQSFQGGGTPKVSDMIVVLAAVMHTDRDDVLAVAKEAGFDVVLQKFIEVMTATLAPDVGKATAQGKKPARAAK